MWKTTIFITYILLKDFNGAARSNFWKGAIWSAAEGGLSHWWNISVKFQQTAAKILKPQKVIHLEHWNLVFCLLNAVIWIIISPYTIRLVNPFLYQSFTFVYDPHFEFSIYRNVSINFKLMHLCWVESVV